MRRGAARFAEIFEVLISQMGERRSANPVLSKTLRVLGHAETFEPVNWRLTGLNIALVAKSAARAQVRARFKNFDHPCDMLFDLVLEDGHWRIDEVTKTLKPRWTMSKILTDAPDAFPDAPPQEKSK